MTRKEIREYARALINEFKEASKGFMKDTEADVLDLNTLINIALHHVHLDLIPAIPWYFQKTVLISVEANKREYDVVTDLSLTDFLMFADIYHNESGKKPDGLLYLEKDQLSDFDIEVGKTGDPIVWSYESKSEIAFDQTPASTIADRYKGVYYYELADLTDDSHSPDMPKACHVLVGIETARQCKIIREDAMVKLNDKYKEIKNIAVNNLLSITPSFHDRKRTKLSARVR